ncbi:unnamed protein product [Kluyveromyces dobzhanskii CBS 2104]|uniref:WGS project CCBQ000000000 data, contig 00106 n=1 Tax=Kluyveromyces dobzhanskii CBS 2104 TaxID=1427455 RepID=A0A0A8L5P7_9SACH|nr:unnamed protein product [Kluyveromyces dobzhanskii CBS 2104]
MSKRIVSDSTGLYKLNLLNKDRKNQDENSFEPKSDTNEHDTDGASQTISAHPPSPRKAPLKINISNSKADDQHSEKEIMTKIANVEDEILQCESRLVSLNQELKALQQELRPVINQNALDDRSEHGSVTNTSPEKSLLGSPTSKWNLFKENGSNLLKKFKDFTINDEDEQEYDDYLERNTNKGIHQFTVKTGLNYEYDSESDPGEDSDEVEHVKSL